MPTRAQLAREAAHAFQAAGSTPPPGGGGGPPRGNKLYKEPLEYGRAAEGLDLGTRTGRATLRLRLGMRYVLQRPGEPRREYIQRVRDVADEIIYYRGDDVRA